MRASCFTDPRPAHASNMIDFFIERVPHNPLRENNGGQDWIRTNEDVSQQIYSLPRLATSVPTLSIIPLPGEVERRTD